MLVAYYSKGCDFHELFDSLNISKAPDYLRHLNQHNVISLNMLRFLSTTNSIEGMINKITRKVTKELKMEYADDCDESVLSDVLSEIYINMNYDGLKKDIIKMSVGEKVNVNTEKMITI